jgi:membrane-bound serine protease (ClpP class)
MALVGAVLLAIFVVPAPWGIPLVVAGALVELGESLLVLRWSRRRRAQAGAEAMLGAEAEVVDARFVRVAGELWQARGLEGRRPGDLVRVRAIHGLTLEVE